jgi:DNA-binding NarL/FixJ family response regulator
VALDAGDPTKAAELALSAAAHADRAAAPIEAAIARLLAGRALGAADDRERAVEELERAANAFEACGATRWREGTERELRKLGRTVHRRTRRSAAGDGVLAELSQRELEVARLVIDRKTNREIAGELFLSMKTVEAHMRNLFRKLGVSSRVDVARTVERAERNQGSE